MLNAGNSIILTIFSYSRCRIIMISLRSKIIIQTTEMINIRRSLHTRQGRRLALPSLTLYPTEPSYTTRATPCLTVTYIVSNRAFIHDKGDALPYRDLHCIQQSLHTRQGRRLALPSLTLYPTEPSYTTRATPCLTVTYIVSNSAFIHDKGDALPYRDLHCI